MVMLGPMIGTAQSRETTEKALALRTALQAYKLSHGGKTVGTYPADFNHLLTNLGEPACDVDNNPADVDTYLTLQGWCGPYVDQVFQNLPNDFKTDGWGTLFLFDQPSGNLTSCGPDRICGGAGAADDLLFVP